MSTLEVNTIAPITGSSDVTLGGSSKNIKFASGTTVDFNTNTPTVSGLTAASAPNTPYWSARGSGLQTISHATDSQATLDSEIVDSDSAFASSTFTVPSGKAGKYFIWFQADLYDADSDITNLTISIKINGTIKSRVYTDFASGSVPSHAGNSIYCIEDLSVGDAVTYYAYMTTNNASTAQLYGSEYGTMGGGFRIA